MIKTIVVGVDGSPFALEATRFAADIAEKFGARMLLAHVVTPVPLPPEGGGAEAAIVEGAQQAGTEILAGITKAVARPGLRVETTVLFGPAAQMLAEQASAENADLLVVGSRGRGAVARVLLGSVADRLNHICRTPLLVFHSASQGERR